MKKLVLCIILLMITTELFSVTDDEIINQTMQLGTITGADDLINELQTIIQGLVDNPVNNGWVGINFTASKPRILYFRGRTVAVLSMCIPLMPGTINDTGTLKGKLASILKAQVTGYLLNNTYWDWEHETTSGGSYITPGNPRCSVEWHHRWRVGPHWDKMYGLWAYAYYTGDWQTLQSNLNFIKQRYTDGYRTADSSQRTAMNSEAMTVYRSGINDLANGLIGYVRIAEHFGDSTRTQARTEAKSALASVLTNINVAWNNATITQGWDNTVFHTTGEWTPGYNLTPELGRWINGNPTQLSQAQSRLNEAANAGELKGHWWCGYINNLWKGYELAGEDMWGMECLSAELFLGRAWMLQESGSTLKQVKPWHTVIGSTPEYMDIPYISCLYALISRYATVTWVTAY